MATLSSSLIVRLIDQVSGPARAVSRSILGLNNQVKGGFGARLTEGIANNNRALDAARGKLFDAAAGFYFLKNAIGAPFNAAVEFESAMADVAKVSDFSEAGLDAFGRQLRKLAVTEIPMAVDQLAALAANAAQAGVPDVDLFDFTRMTAKAAVAWEMSGAQAGEALAKIRSQLQLTNAQTEAFADAINHLSDRSAASANDLVDYAKRVSAQGEFFGFAKEQTLAFGSAMIGAGAQSEVAATSFRNMGRALTRGAGAPKRAIEAYKTLGLEAGKVAEAMQQDAVGTTLEVMERLAALPAHMQASVMTDLFGDEARALAPLLNNLEIIRQQLGYVAQETDYAGSVNEEFARRAQTAQYAMQRFKSQINEIGIVIGNALIPALNDIMATLGPIVLKFAEFAEAHPGLIRGIVGATAAIIGFKIATATLTFVGLLGRGGALSMLALGFNTVGRAAIGASRGAKGMLAYQDALAAMAGAKPLSGLARFSAGLRGIALAVPGIAPLGGALTAAGTAIAGISLPVWGSVAAIAAAIGGAGLLIWKYWDRISSVMAGVGSVIADLVPDFEITLPHAEKFAKLGEGIGQAWEGAKNVLGSIGSFISDLFSQETLTDEQKAAMYDAGREWAQRMVDGVKAKIGELIDWFKDLPRRIIEAIGKIDIGSLISWPSLPSWMGGGPVTEPIQGHGGNTIYPVGQAPTSHRATGGPVWPGSSFLVGERQPEIFTPRSAGEITPLSKLGGGGRSIIVEKLIVQEASNAKATAQAVAEELDRLARGAHSDSEAWT